jgi:hypothetical protein
MAAIYDGLMYPYVHLRPKTVTERIDGIVRAIVRRRPLYVECQRYTPHAPWDEEECRICHRAGCACMFRPLGVCAECAERKARALHLLVVIQRGRKKVVA